MNSANSCCRRCSFSRFNLILFTNRLILEHCLVQYSGSLIATTAALVVGKSVLVANTMPLLRGFDNAPLAYPVVFKTFVYTLFVFVARLIEAALHYLIEGVSWAAAASSSISSATSPEHSLRLCSCGFSSCT